MSGKGSRRRPEDAAAIARNWPFDRLACPSCAEPMSTLFASAPGWIACPDCRVDYDAEALRAQQAKPAATTSRTSR